jgi:hypothetical protein
LGLALLWGVRLVCTLLTSFLVGSLWARLFWLPTLLKIGSIADHSLFIMQGRGMSVVAFFALTSFSAHLGHVTSTKATKTKVVFLDEVSFAI